MTLPHDFTFNVFLCKMMVMMMVVYRRDLFAETRLRHYVNIDEIMAEISKY